MRRWIKFFEASEESELQGCLDLHYTPKHGNWSNIAGIESGLFSFRYFL